MMGEKTLSGVWVADDYHDNLIIDRYDPHFDATRGIKTTYMHSENSEDVLTWNVFRSLRQIEPTFWFPNLFRRAFRKSLDQDPQFFCLDLWQIMSALPTRRFSLQGARSCEVDVLIETEYTVWCIEAKYKSDITKEEIRRPEINQILRNIDVGSWYAGTRDFYFAFLFLSKGRSKRGVTLVTEYMQSRDKLVSMLPHRVDRLANLKEIGLLTWTDMAAILSDCYKSAPREDERYFAKRALEWLSTKGIVETPS